MKIGSIAAVSPEGIIGADGGIPWHYRGDLRRFKRLTLGTTVIMGRVTWESLGKKALPGRRNIVLTSGTLLEVEHYPDALSAILAIRTGDIWFIGGARVYAEALRFCDIIDLTYVPDCIVHPNPVYFPPIDPLDWEEGDLLPHEDEPALTRRIYTRIPPF
jgi:dihydrofolate reductase